MTFLGIAITDWLMVLISMLSDLLMVLISMLLSVLTYFAYKVNKQIAWFTGAMETHSTWMLRIEAARGINGQPRPVIWWDPTVDAPPFAGAHGQEASLDPIYLYLPPKYRGRHNVSSQTPNKPQQEAGG